MSVATAKDVAEPVDFITVLRCLEPLTLTKTWQADGSVRPYDDAKHYHIREYQLTGIHGLHKLLVKISPDARSSAVRGRFIGAARAQEVEKPSKPDLYRKIGSLFDEVPHHWFMTDVDGFRPEGIDPCLQPVEAISQYIERCLPAEFQGVTYVWQLSASAGAPGKEGILKAHLWFWLRGAYTGSQLTAWARATGAELDVSVLRNVQHNYTAAPRFEDGATDPVPVRLGIEQGWASDEVDLTISEAILAGVHEYEAGESKDLIDPKTKPGLIGLFCRVYSIEEVMERWLDDVFEFQDGSERRLNFLQGGGSPGGAFISDCREYIVNMHDSDPMQTRATNKWDLVRHYVYGELDDGADPLELAVISQRPSHLAMMDMVAALPEVLAAQREAKSEAAGVWKDRVAGAADEFALREVADSIRREPGLDVVALEQLAGLIQGKFRSFGIKLPIAAVRGLTGCTARGARAAPQVAGNAPAWARPWCFVTDGDVFFDTGTKEKVSERGFNAMYTRNMKPFADPITGIVPSASGYCLNEWHLPCVSHMTYMPTAGAVFDMLGSTWANTYRPDSVPDGGGDYKTEGSAGYAAVETIKAHMRKFIPNRRERRLFASWLAHNVKFPGVKIRWAPYVHGYEGDGKSFFVELLGTVMGGRQVRTVSGSTLESNFTDWAIGYAVVVIEEMKQHGHNRYEVMNRIKPFITNGTVEIHPKGRASYSAPNTANYLILSNYLDGAPIDENSRRYMFLSSGIRMDELQGMNDSGYFAKLFGTLTEANAIRQWLLDFDLDEEFDADGRAPETEIKKTVVELTRTETESLARDAIEHGVEGVCCTALSAQHLSGFVKDQIGDDADVNTHRINSLLTRLGFRFYARKKWRGAMRRVWIKGPDRFWSEIKSELDVTEGRDFEAQDDE